jgi:hypothetical protein
MQRQLASRSRHKNTTAASSSSDDDESFAEELKKAVQRKLAPSPAPKPDQRQLRRKPTKGE